MLKRFLKLKDAIIATLAITQYDSQLVRADWILMEKVVHCLESFAKATEYMSSRKAHIGM